MEGPPPHFLVVDDRLPQVVVPPAHRKDLLLLEEAMRGPVAGAIIFWVLITGLGTFFSQATRGPDPLIPAAIMDSQQASLMRFIITGLGLMLLMIFRPQGIFGDRRELALDAR